jgi:hypothetical protein
MSADPVAALVAYLKADAGVAALVGTRIFGLELPAAEASAMPRKAVVLQASGGAPLVGGYLEHTAQRIDAFAYGETPYEAERVRRAVFDSLKQLRRAVAASTLIHWVEDAGGFSTQRDPDGGWPVSFQSFQTFFATAAAA